MKENAMKAWEIDVRPDALSEALNLIKLDAQQGAPSYLASAKVDLGGE